MSAPLVIIQIPDPNETPTLQTEFIVIAVYDKQDNKVPPAVCTQRVFASDVEPFRFPTDINEGATKVRVVYRYSLEQWHELLQSTTFYTAATSIKQIMVPSLMYMRDTFPGIFDDIDPDPDFGPDQYGELIPMA